MEKFNRSQRRLDTQRLKDKRKRYWRMEPEQRTAKQLGRVVQYPAACSCTMCGNERKHFGHRTIEELSFYQTKLHTE